MLSSTNLASVLGERDEVVDYERQSFSMWAVSLVNQTTCLDKLNAIYL